MGPDVEHNVFAGALGLWLGYLLAAAVPENIDWAFAQYIVIVFLGVIVVVALLRLAFMKKKGIHRLLAYLGALVLLVFVVPAIIHARDHSVAFTAVREWQIGLIWVIVAAWVLAAEVGMFIDRHDP